MPVFDFTDTSGKRWTNADFKGRSVLVEFWATWCVPCRELAPEIDRFAADHGSAVTLLSVCTDKEDRVFRSQFISLRPTHPQIYAGVPITKTWSVRQLPALALVRDGRVVIVWEGTAAVREGLNTAASTAGGKGRTEYPR